MQILLPNQSLYAYTGGKDFDPKKPTAVFIHGVLNDHSVWVLQSRYLAHHGWNVLAIDLPGHCKSHGQPVQSVAEAAATVIALLDALHISKAASDRPQLWFVDRSGCCCKRCGATQRPSASSGAGRYRLPDASGPCFAGAVDGIRQSGPSPWSIGCRTRPWPRHLRRWGLALGYMGPAMR